MEFIITGFKVPKSIPPKVEGGEVFEYEDTTAVEWVGMSIEFEEPEAKKELIIEVIDGSKKHKTRKLF